ncbi:MAG: TadE/TadG family type IV pilus assembly protein [Terracidiphilus sp.]
MSELKRESRRATHRPRLMTGGACGLASLRRLRNLPRGEHGATLVESAITLLLFLALLLGVIEFGWLFLAYQNVSDAARQAARWASVRGGSSCWNVSNLPYCNATSADITNYVQNLYEPAIDSSKLAVTTNWCAANWNQITYTTSWPSCSTAGSNAAGNQVQVTVTYQFPITIPYLNKTFTLTSTGAMAIAQ